MTSARVSPADEGSLPASGAERALDAQRSAIATMLKTAVKRRRVVPETSMVLQSLDECRLLCRTRRRSPLSPFELAARLVELFFDLSSSPVFPWSLSETRSLVPVEGAFSRTR